VAVSDYSDYPEQATTLPSVASYQGANIAEIIRLKPTHILVWQGGNKATDIQRLKQQGYSLYLSSINSPSELQKNISDIGEFLNAQQQALIVNKRIQKQIEQISAQNQAKESAIYYLNTVPFIGLGNDPWLNSLLSLCGIHNLYKNDSQAYPQLDLANIIRHKPEIIIAATGSTEAVEQQFWHKHRAILERSRIISVNPDALHRFTPRAIDEAIRLCDVTRAP
jgi:vitamin B12 transport system substrate-binding protein